jgi:hypothetical protein
MRLFDRLSKVADVTTVHDCVADLRALDDGRDLTWTEHWHCRNYHTASFQDGEPGSKHCVGVCSPEQDPVSGHQLLLLNKEPRDPPAEVTNVSVAPSTLIVKDREIVRLSAL